MAINSAVDFSGLVLGPCMDAFSVPITVTPVQSQPMAGPYPARGSLHVDNIEVMAENGEPFATRVLKCGIKMDEFSNPPVQYDIITLNVSDLPMGYRRDVLTVGSTADFTIDNPRPDGQGGMTLVLKRKT